jgi:hypothetical protein
VGLGRILLLSRARSELSIIGLEFGTAALGIAALGTALSAPPHSLFEFREPSGHERFEGVATGLPLFRLNL